ncbi:MAG TPA: TetR/AcrR family transcriptional regulator [Pirellulales bacterium]|jgi:AcrR family transcriptional regulator|nr:TetR/AcrR family transcriptional regulator [Pirellulales bacterium]
MSSSSPVSADSKDRRSQRRQNIVETAAALFAQWGYAGCEMERVANQLGIAKGTLYLYFPGKQDLFFACVDWAMTQLQDAIRAAADSAKDDPFEQISRAVRAYLVFFQEHPEYVELLIKERAIFRDRKRPAYYDYRDSIRSYWRDLYAGLIRDGRFRGDLNAEVLLDMIGNLLYGTMFTNHFIGSTMTVDEQHRALLDIIFRGILSDSERATLGK